MLDRFRILGSNRVDCSSQVNMRQRRAGISLYPKQEGFFGQVIFTNGHVVEGARRLRVRLNSAIPITITINSGKS